VAPVDRFAATGHGRDGRLTAGPDGMTASEAADVAFAGVAGQAALLAEGSLTSVDLVELLLERIARLQPTLNAFRAVLADEARREARVADEQRGGGDRRPLLGVPIAIKDNVPVAGQRFFNGTGSPTPPASADDELVRRLRRAGLVVIGLTQLPELALWAATESAHHGVTRNPWDTNRAPGGSSGGSAAAVAAGLVPAAHATDGLGSIRIPASSCGLVGLKPTHGLVPLGPDIDHWEGLSHAGFVTRTVRDTALLLDAVVEPSPGLTGVLEDTSPRRVALSLRPTTPVRIDPQVRSVVEAAADALRAAGHAVTEHKVPYGGIANANSVRYLAGVAHDVDLLDDPAATERRTRQLAFAGRRLPRRLVERARDGGAAFARRMDAVFTDCDVLLTPTVAKLPVAAGSIVGRSLPATLRPMLPRAAFTGAWNGSGLPAVSLPFGQTPADLPIGVQLIGPAGSEGVLLALGAALEAASGWPQRRPPVD
jgi:amidase